ncbi:MAG: glycosyltransferase [Methanobrevibacter sp.]|uniref:glycosyltransferase family 2 protein n=1 Tax=Methanobrevibacter sp. TaxID=66852 RepID=UPI0025E8FFC3|nr:glycosyltransferase family 2 protein [Methanobrevibacter sp.]MBE6498071.1 glycosyltransferase [Methanobrevibacter sp.]MBE6499360.1 glycosyltransferase [Methanobrevibacter thaueri]
MKTAVLIPCYNEAKTIRKVVSDFKRVMPHAEIYVYDNNSTDGTDKIAEDAGAIVRYEYKQGKGNVVRAMFRQINADCYIMVDGDDTYPAEAACEIERIILENRADMVIGDRLSSTYFEENNRPFHNTGNRVVRKFINIFFKSDLKDIMTGMRGFNYDFAKSFPIQSKGFEIETEMSVFALINNFKIHEIPIDYRDRMDGSESKLNTYRDGYRVLRMISSLIRDERPLLFFSAISLILLIIAGAYFFPILFRFFSTGYVLKIPTLIVISTVVIIASVIFFTGVILHVLNRQHRDELERHLILLNELKEE